jgi:hypothetical protein
MVLQVGLRVLQKDRQVFACHKTIADTIWHSELGASLAIVTVRCSWHHHSVQRVTAATSRAACIRRLGGGTVAGRNGLRQGSFYPTMLSS